MTLAQRFILSLMLASWAKAAEAESRTWVLVCGKCRHEESIWDAGGIRWGASGKSFSFRRCRSCKALGWQRVMRKTT